MFYQVYVVTERTNFSDKTKVLRVFDTKAAADDYVSDQVYYGKKINGVVAFMGTTFTIEKVDYDQC